MVHLPDTVRHSPTTDRMSARAFREAINALGWTQHQAAELLGVSSRSRVNDWARGRLKVPRYHAAHLHTHLRLRACEERV